MSLLDRALASVAPGFALRRARARYELAALTGATAAYDGATRSWRTSGRLISRSDANAEIRVSLKRLRDVSRDLVRNNPYAARAVSSRVANTVGAGILPQISGASAPRKRALADLIKRHLMTSRIDKDGLLNLPGLEALAERARSESGEALIVRYVPTAAQMRRRGLSVPLQIRVLEGDHLDEAKTQLLPNGHYVFMGVEFDAEGERVAYWLFDEHPGGRDFRRGSIVSKRVPAEDVIHYFHVLRPGQARGVPDGAPVVMTQWDLGEYEDARLMREKIAACFVAFWRRGDGASTMVEGMRQSDQARAAGLVTKDLAPGLMQELPPGAEVQFGSPPATEGHADYVKASVRRIAIGYDLPYEEVSGDLSNVSFLSGRLGEVHLARRVDQWQWHALIPTVCERIGEWFLDAASIMRPIPVGVSIAWTAPRRALLSPKDEIPAMRDAIRSGLMSRQETVRSLGYDVEERDAEEADDLARADRLRLQHDSDGRKPRQGPTQTLEPQVNDQSLNGGQSA